MAFSCKVGSFAGPTATGNKAVTGVGFQPKVIILWGNLETADTDTGSTCLSWIGMATSTSQRAAVSVELFGTNAGYQANDACVYMLSTTNTTQLKADFISFDADGFTLNFSTASTNIINYMALGGADLTNAAVKQITTPASTGNQATTGVGFKPDCILGFWINDATAPDHLTTVTASFGLGAASATTSRWTTTTNWSGGGSNPPRQYQRTNAVLAIVEDTTKVVEADLVSFDSDGFTLNYSTTTSGQYIFFLCLKGGNFNAGSFNQPTSTGNKAVTGVGFTPVGEFFTSGMAAAGTTIAGPFYVSLPMIGAMSGSTARGVISQTEKYSTPFTELSTLNRSNAIELQDTGGSGGVVAAKADFSSHDTDGFTLNFGTADSNVREILYLAFGSAASGTIDSFPAGYGQPLRQLQQAPSYFT